MKLQIRLFFYFIFLIFLFACSDKTRNDLTNPVVYLDNYGPCWTIYGDYLNVSDLDSNMLYVTNQYSDVNFSYKEGENTAIKLYWDGSIAENKNYYGFYLQFKTAKDLTSAGYNKIKFQVKGTLNSNFLEVKGINTNNTDKISILNTDISDTVYKSFEIPITVSLANVSQIIGAAVKSANRDNLNTEESTLYIDNIELVKE